jgi:hypothetical protein
MLIVKISVVKGFSEWPIAPTCSQVLNVSGREIRVGQRDDEGHDGCGIGAHEDEPSPVLEATLRHLSTQALESYSQEAFVASH